MNTSSSSQHNNKRKPRADKGMPQLTRRDLDMLRLIGEQTVYRFDQLQGVLARHPDTHSVDPTMLSETRTSAIIGRWKQLGLAEYRKIRYDEPGWIWLTRKGLYHVNLSLRFLDPRHSDLEHCFWINETRVLVEERYGSRPGFQWESERQYRAQRERLKAQQKQDLDLWLPLEYQGTHRPDAVIRYRTTHEPDAPIVVSAIETECSEKDGPTWQKIFLDLTRFFQSTHYYVNPGVKPSLSKALKKFQQEEPLFGDPSTERRQSIFIHDLEQRL